MIKIVIELTEVKVPEGRVGGKINCKSRQTDPVTDEERWLASCIFDAIRDIGEGISSKKGGMASIAEFTIPRRRKRRNDNPGDSRGNQRAVR